MRVTILVDNLAPAGLRAEHGLSFLVETGRGAVLFDTGQTDAWRDNMVALGHDPLAIRAVALSHGHYDHTGGLAALPRKGRASCHLHPAAVWPRYALGARGAREIGITGEAVQREHGFTYNRSASEILPGVILSGEIPIEPPALDPSAGRFFEDPEGRRPDAFTDEQCLILREGGQVGVLVGCSHRGIENNIRAAMRIAGTSHLAFVAGGMHLGGATRERLAAVAEFLADTQTGRIVCCHCTGEAAYEYLRERLGPRIERGRAGMCWSLEAGAPSNAPDAPKAEAA